MIKIRVLLVSMLFSVFCCPLISQAQLDEAAMMTTAKGHYQEGGYYYASTWFERVLKNWPATAQREEILLMMAKSYAATGREDKAARTVKTLLQDYPQSAPKLDQDLLKLVQETDAVARPIPALQEVDAPAPALAAPVLAQAAAPAGAAPDAAKQDAFVAPAEPAAAKVPNEVKAPSTAGTLKPEVVKPAVEEAAKPAVAEAVKPAIAEAVKPVVAEAAKPAAEETAKPAVAEAATAKPAVAEVAKPAAEEPATPAAEDAAKPAVAEAAKPAAAEAAKPAAVVATPAPAPLNPVAVSADSSKTAETETACRDNSAAGPGTYAIELGEFIGKNALVKGKRAVKKAGLMPVAGPGPQKVEVMLRILVGEFTDQGAAKKVLNKLRKAGAEQFMLKDKEGTYRIYAGSYFEHQAALDEQKRLLAKGFPSELKQATVPVSTYVINAGCFETEEVAKGKLAELERLGMKGKVRR